MTIVRFSKYTVLIDSTKEDFSQTFNFPLFSRDAVVWNRIKITQNMSNIRQHYFCLQVDVWTVLNDVWKWIEETILNQQIWTRIKI